MFLFFLFYDTSINGMNINNSEYLLSQYADDSSLILDGGDDPLRKSLYILENFSEGENLKWNQSIITFHLILAGFPLHKNE
jgi:hypothetical protein